MQYDEYQPGQSDRSLYMSAFGKAVLWLTSDKFWSLHEKKKKKMSPWKKEAQEMQCRVKNISVLFIIIFVLLIIR